MALRRLTLSALLFGLLISVAWSDDSRQAPPDPVTFMHQGLEALTNLQPFVAVPEKFNDPGNREEIQKNLDTLAGMKHVFPKSEDKIEPGFSTVSGLFTGFVGEVAEDFRQGAHRAYLSREVRAITGLCLSCHTRMPNHIAFDELISKTKVGDLNALQKLEYFASTRQYEKALAEFDNVLNRLKTADFGFSELPNAIHTALTISVRVKHDPALTKSLIAKVEAVPGLPDFYARYLNQWKLDVAAWSKDKLDPEKAAAPALVSRARELVRQAEKAQYYSVDLVGEISYLRASRYLHQALDLSPKASFRAEALLLLGRCYASLQDPFYWGMDKLYFEACVRDKPHTALARDCYGRYAGALATASQKMLTMLLDREQLEKLKALKALAR